MPQVIFYEKPGCITNRRQKRLLKLAGIEVEEKNLLRFAWSPALLAGFFGDMPVTQWFNTGAPQIKSGKIDTQQLSAPEAMALLIREPILIRRPLIESAAGKWCGFNLETISQSLGLSCVSPSTETIEGCSHDHEGSCSP